MATRPASSPSDAADRDGFVLAAFLPYRLSVLSNRVSKAIARLYEREFGLTIPDGRVIAVLGARTGLTAGDNAMATEMDKVAISRAVSRLTSAGRLIATPDAADRRRLVLSLTHEGERGRARILPLAVAVEGRLLATLPAEDRRALDKALSALSDAAERL